MPFIPQTKSLHWTFHAHDKMRFYGLSESRVRRVLHSPKRIEEGVAPKTIAFMQPSSIKTTIGGSAASNKREETWTQEIWVMVEDKKGQRKVISAWRYPGKTKPRDSASIQLMRQAYREYKSSPK